MKKNIYLLGLLFFVSTFFVYGQKKYNLDNSFTQNAGTGLDGGSVSISLLQTDGKILVAGSFSTFNGTTRNNILRLNADGALDVSFDPGATFSGSTITDMVLDASGNVYVSGTFTEKVVRLSSTGTVDGTFTFDATNFAGPINAITLDNNGKLLVGEGNDGSDNASKIGRFNSDGTEDNTFTQDQFSTPNSTGLGGLSINGIAVDSNGKIYVGGNYSSFTSMPAGQRNLVRLNSDGTYDNTFSRSSIDDELAVLQLELASDGKLLLSNFLSTAFGATRRIQRFNVDGSLDENLTFIDGGPSDFAELDNDLLVVAGSFEADQSFGFTNTWGPGVNLFNNSNYSNAVNRLVELGFGFSASINATSVLQDQSGGIITFGNFSDYGGAAIAGGIARLEICESITLSETTGDARICVGETATFEVNATSANPLTYQWQVNTNGTDGVYTDLADDATYSGTSTATLSVVASDVNFADYSYKCIIDDGTCQETVFTSIVVNEQTVFDVQPADLTACLGEDVTFTVQVSGAFGNGQERIWQVDSLNGNGFQDVGFGVNSFTVNIGQATEAMNGYKYRFVVSQCNTPVISDEAVLTVVGVPELVSASDNVALCESGDANFSVEATGEGTLTYQWQYLNDMSAWTDLTDGGVYSGVTTNSLSVTGADNTLAEIVSSSASLDAAVYRCVISNANGCERNSPERRLELVKVEPTITSQPDNFEVCYTQGVLLNGVFSVQATDAFSYKWQVDTGTGFVDLEEDSIFRNVDTQNLGFSNVTDSLDGFRFQCVVGPCGNVVSDIVTMVIDTNPTVSNLLEVDEVQNPTVCVGSEVTFRIETNAENSTFQWQINGANISPNDTRFTGINTSQLTISDISTDLNNSQFSCIVNTENQLCNARQSLNRRLTVVSDVTFNNSTSEAVVEFCENATDEVIRRTPVNFRNGFHSYRWQVAFKNSDVFIDATEGDTYSNVNSAILTIDTASISLDSTKYRLVVKGCATDFISDTTLLTINQAPIITNSGPNQILCLDEDTEAVFAVSAIGDNLTYLWETSSSPDGPFTAYTSLSEENDTLRIDINRNNLTLSGSYFRARVLNGETCNQTATSSAAQLIINEVTIISGPTNNQVTGCVGDQYVLNLVASGEGLTYEWQVDDGSGNFSTLNDNDVYSGTNTSDLTILALSAEMADLEYRCVVGGNCESKTSESISPIVQVVETPVITSDRVSGELQLSVGQSFNGINWFDEGGNVVSSENPYIPLNPGTYTAEIFIGNCSAVSEPFVVETILSVEPIVGLQLYPNPVIDVVTIKSDFSKIDRIELIDVSGRILKSLEGEGGEVQLSLDGQKAGIYFINIYAGEKVQIERIIKQ